MDMKCLALTLGLGAALGAVAILMMPQNNPTRKLVDKAADKVEDVAEKQLALSAIMKAQTGKDFSFEPKMTTIVTIVKIKVSEYTAKHRPIPEKSR